MTISKCPETLPEHLIDLLSKFALGWTSCSDRPKPNSAVCERWERLLQEWVADNSLPLFARKANRNRGHAFTHKATGRIIVPTDNSPAQWVFTKACNEECPSINDLRTWLAIPSVNQERIPIAMAFSREEKNDLTFGMTLSKAKDFDVNRQGWKLGHIEGIGLKKKGDLISMNIDELRKHHLAFLRPANMFVIPKRWAGLAEIHEVASAMINCREHLYKTPAS